MKKIFLSITIVSFLFHISCLSLKAEEFEIKHADNLEADKGTINIKGNILIKYKDATIEAPQGFLETNEEGKPYQATFTGRAKIKLKDRKIEGDKITVNISDQVVRAFGNTISELKDKKSVPITIASDFQELFWSGEDANATGNIRATYMDTVISSDEAKIVYKNKKPYQAIFTGTKQKANLEQPNNVTSASRFVFDINTQNLEAQDDVISVIWPDEKKTKEEQPPIHLTANELFIDQESSTITAKSNQEKQVMLDYETTVGESNEGILLRDKSTGKPQQIIFKGKAIVSQVDKKLASEEIVFNVQTKKLTSNTKDQTRPKTTFFKKKEQ